MSYDPNFIAWDTETHLFRPGYMAPRIVCWQWCTFNREPEILLRDDGLKWFHWALDSGRTLVGHGVPYDLRAAAALDASLLPKIFQALEERRITDTELRQKLADIGRGRYRTRQYNLGAVAGVHGFHVDKEDPWRLRYGELDGIPLEQWPEEAKAYALKDAAATACAYVGQGMHYDPALLVDEFNQTYKFFALDLCSGWGIRTSARGVASLESGAREREADLHAILVEEGLVRENGSRNTKVAKARMVEACEELGIEVKPTKTGDISLDSDACLESGDPLLEAYTEYSSIKKVISNDVEMLKQGIEYPVHTNFDLAYSGRTTSSKPNIQNPRRLPGVRECFIPRS